jgi:hypothetical protein
VRLADRAQHALDSRSQAVLVDRALEQPGLDPRAGDAVANVLHEQLDHRLRHVEDPAGAGEVKLHRLVVVGVDARRDDDVDAHLLVDALHPRDVAPEAEDRRIDDGPDPARGALPELGHRISDPVILVPGIRIVRIVLPDLGTEGEAGAHA